MFGLTPFNNRRLGVNTVMRNPFDFAKTFDEFFNDSTFPSLFQSNGGIKVDVIDEGKQYVIEAELPTTNKEEVSVELKDDILTISVNKNEAVDDNEDKYIYRERKAYSMSRSFTVENVRTEEINAQFKEGILTISLPKKEKPQDTSRAIEIQ